MVRQDLCGRVFPGEADNAGLFAELLQAHGIIDGVTARNQFRRLGEITSLRPRLQVKPADEDVHNGRADTGNHESTS